MTDPATTNPEDFGDLDPGDVKPPERLTGEVPNRRDPATTIREAILQMYPLRGTAEQHDAYDEMRRQGIAALTELEQQLAGAWDFEHKMMERATEAEEKLEAAERERDQLADTLREIAALTPYVDASSTSSVVKAPALARAALDRQTP